VAVIGCAWWLVATLVQVFLGGGWSRSGGYCVRVVGGCDSCASLAWVGAGAEVAELDEHGGWLRLYYASFALPTVGQQSVLVAHYCMARVFHCVQPAK
jgi:hypothetical protein